MASFRTPLQISSLSLPTMQTYIPFKKRNPTIRLAAKQTVRSFWSRKSTSSSRESIERSSGSCSRPRYPRMEPCAGCPSRCLEAGYGEPVKKPKRGLFSFRKEPVVVKQKPSNCKVVEKPVEKFSIWEYVFGPDPKKSWPDPCSCRMAYRQKQKCRAEDPRLCDPRYRATPGDVLIFTELQKQTKRRSDERLPKPPPPFKPPKAVVFKMLSDTAERVLCGCKGSDWQKGDQKSDETVVPKPHAIPYEEMRPPDTRRRHFTCRDGIGPKDIIKPFSKESNPYGIPYKKTKVDSEHGTHINFYTEIVKIAEKFDEQSIPEGKPVKRSRIEQLKILLDKKNKCKCFPLDP